MDEFTPLNLFREKKVEEKEILSNEKAISESCVEENIEAAGKEAETVELSEACPQEEVMEADEQMQQVEKGNTTLNTDECEEMVHLEKGESKYASDKIDEILGVQQQILEQIESLNKLFNTRIMHTNHEEKVVDQMHKELQKYKEDIYAQLVRPILLDVIDVRDSIIRMTATYLAKPEGEQNIPNKIFSDYAFDLQDILEKNNVVIYRSKAGDEFTPIKQRVVKKVATSEEALHGKVSESLSCGYSYNGRTISAEKITMYYYEKPVEKTENCGVIENG